MPDMRLEKARATLPTGYQFGDAGKSPVKYTWRLATREDALLGLKGRVRIVAGTAWLRDDK